MLYCIAVSFRILIFFSVRPVPLTGMLNLLKQMKNGGAFCPYAAVLDEGKTEKLHEYAFLSVIRWLGCVSGCREMEVRQAQLGSLPLCKRTLPSCAGQS